ncbi:MAG TPA: TonB-dependent receptor [Arachidicoccus sp.]|nr:TonB-dependent receptor [Arachidicoccus sp.]
MKKKDAAVFMRCNHLHLKLNTSLLVLFLTLCATAISQNMVGVSGHVNAKEDGKPLIGVSIQVKGSSTGALTDGAGYYKIQVPLSGSLIFRYVGYDSVELRVGNLPRGQDGNDRTADITMLSNNALQEVMVSYGRQKRSEVTGSIAQVSATELQDMPVGQFAQQLQGKVPGVQIAQSSGQPGRGMEFRIRGAASLFADNQPLFVIDGLPITGSINNINPAEIETFTVLKDASATSLYGSRAANGVILITTKHAKAGDAKLSFSSNYGIQKIPMNKVPAMMNAREFATFMKERYEDQVKYEGLDPQKKPIDPVYANPEQYGEGTNWFNVLTRSAPIQSYDLTLSSARDKSSSTVMAGYQEQQGVIINTSTKLYSLRFNQELTLSNQLKIGFNLAPSYRIDHNNRLGSDGVNGLWAKITESSPLIAPVNPDGTLPLIVSSPGMVTYINPYAQYSQIKDDYKTTRILGNGYLNYAFMKGFTFKANVGIDKGAETYNNYTPSTAISSGLATGNSSSVDNYSWTAEANLQYDRTFAEKHNIEALIGYSAQKFDQESNHVAGTNFPSDDVPWLSAATAISSGGSNTTHYALLSEFGRLNYNYMGKYLFSGAIRRDGSSRFGQNKKYGYFPSVSGGWVLTRETFMKGIHFLSHLKIRASYGITGNNNIGNYTFVSSLGDYNYPFNNTLTPGIANNLLGNPDLAWERNKQFDIGLDASFFNNRLNFTYDYYHKMTDGLIQDRQIPRASGYSSIKYNVGAIEFWGHEFAVDANILDKTLKWNAGFNISIDRNRIESLVDPGFIRRNNTVTSDYYRNQVGHPLGAFYGFVYEGLYKDADDLANSAQYGSNSDVGTLKMKDVSGPDGQPDGLISDAYDRTFIGDPTPDFLFGFSNSFQYKSFDLNISSAGSVGGQILTPGKWAYNTNMDGSRNLLAAALDHWRSEENPGSGIYPRTKSGTTAIGREVNSQWVENGTYLTVKNITVGYQVPLQKNRFLSSLRLYFSVQQVFTITGYSGMNPEINLSGLDASKGIGVDEFGYPVPRTFSIGFTTTFK